MELKPGYKRTEVGVIPEDWDVSTVEREFSVQLGKMLDAEGNLGIPKPYLGNRAVQWGRIDATNLATVPMSRQDLQKFRLIKGDLLVCEGGEVGRAAIWDAPLSECYYQKALHRLRPLRGFDPRLMVAILRQWSERGVLANYVTQTSIAHLPREKFIEIPIPRPSLPEQREIAEALSDVDALLEGLTRLIAKKRDLKQAAMQQLLTGQTRLPGFDGEWEVKSLGELGWTYGGLTGKTKTDFGEGRGRYVTFMNVMANVVIDCGIFERVKTSPTESQNRVLKGDLIFNGSSETPEEVAMCAVLTIDVADLFLNSFCFGFRLRDDAAAASLFLAYLLRGEAGRELIKSLAQGSTRYNVSKAALLNSPLRLPTLSEQTAIAAVLSDMDAELSALDARRDKTRALKQAMMQELLTGRTRLVIPAVTERRKDAERTDGRQANIHFKRSVLAAEIIERLHEEPTFGHVKFEKTIFLVEHLCDVDTGSTYHRDAAGPYDNRAMRSIDSQLRKQKWFDAQKIDGRYRYQPMGNRGKHKAYFERYFGGIGATFDMVIDTFRDFTTERCEMVATLFAAWNDLLQQNRPISDDAIVDEVLNNWHESKKRIPEDRWRKALFWMRDRGFVPRKATGAV